MPGGTAVLRYGTARSKTAFQFTRVGLAGCDMGACAILPRIIGQGRAAELLYTGRSMQGDEAERWGFLNRLCEPDALLGEPLLQGPAQGRPLQRQQERGRVERLREAGLAGRDEFRHPDDDDAALAEEVAVRLRLDRRRQRRVGQDDVEVVDRQLGGGSQARNRLTLIAVRGYQVQQAKVDAILLPELVPEPLERPPVHRPSSAEVRENSSQALIAAPSTAGTLVQLASWSSAVMRRMS